MASLRDIRKRIRSVKNTQQITKAMKMVAAAKLRKAQDAILAARPYAEALDLLMGKLVSRSDPMAESLAHPLLESRPIRTAELIVLTSDRGLAGGFNANVLRRASRFLAEDARVFEKVRVSTFGRKGNEFLRRRGVEIRRDYPGLLNPPRFGAAAEVAKELSDLFLRQDVDAVFVLYNEFLSAVNQRIALVPLLPFQASPSAPGSASSSGSAPGVEFKYEPGRPEVLSKLVPEVVAVRLYRAMLESTASEHGARMSAMENATSNASDMIGNLTLYYNRTRQAVITKELMEIVSGAEASR